MEKPRVFLEKKEKFRRKEATLRRCEKTVMFKHTTAFLFLTLFALAPLWAQSSKVAVEGAVIDSTGGVLMGTDVFLRNSRSGLEVHQVTDGQGRYRFMAAPGHYELTAAETGFESVTKTLDVTDAKGVQLNLELAPEILADQVVVVSGSREQELSENSTTKVDIIPSTMLHDTGYETVRDVLSEEPGIITRSGSSGNRSETQIQGIDSRQSLILIDGLPIVGAKGIKSGILNMDRHSVGRLDRIEIVKGASSALYGSDAIGGVINMITRKPTQAFEGSLTASGGTLNRFDARSDMGFIKDKWSGFFEVERHKRNPYSLLRDDIRTTGYGFHRYDYLGKLAYKFSENVSLRTMANAFVNQEKGRYQGTFGPTGTLTNDSAQNYSAVMDIGLSPLTQWNLRGYYGKYDESSALDVFSQPGEINSTANLNQRLYRLDSSVSQVIGSRQLLQGGVEWTQDQYRGYNRVLGDNAGQGITMVDLWFNDRISVHNRLSVTLGGRFNNHSRYGKHFVPRASALFRVTDDLRKPMPSSANATAITATLESFTTPTGWEDCGPICAAPISVGGPSPVAAAAPSAIPTRSGTGTWPSLSREESNCSPRWITCSTARIRG